MGTKSIKSSQIGSSPSKRFPFSLSGTYIQLESWSSDQGISGKKI